MNWCKTNVGIRASQPYPLSICTAMPAGLYSRWEIDSESAKFKPRQNKTKGLKTWSVFEIVRPQCKMESFHKTGTRKKIDPYSVDCFRGHCNTVFDAMRCYYRFCQEILPSSIEEEIRRGFRKRKLDDPREQYLQ